MLKLVTSYDFETGLAIDLSGNNNHGQVMNTTLSSGPTAGSKSLYFDGNDSKVIIPTSDSFVSMGALQVQADIRILEYGHRHNIVEGSGAFAFFVNNDGSIQGTVNDGSPSWLGLNSGSSKLALNTWTNVQYLYDGFSSGRLYINGDLVSSDFDMRVPIPNVNASGVFIGNWPGGDGVYPMHGEITNVKIWKLDQQATSTALYVAMQQNPQRQVAWNDIVEQLGSEGMSDCFERLVRFYQDLVYMLRKNNPAVVNETDAFSARFFKLLVSDPSGAHLQTLINNYFAFLAANVPSTTWAALMEEAKAIERECFTDIKPSDPILTVAERAIGPEFQKLSKATSVSFRRTVLKDVDRTLWPGGTGQRLTAQRTEEAVGKERERRTAPGTKTRKRRTSAE